ncbi:MAG: hypothetical protein M3340_00910 [Actinomycetota bacterium]|nr:hypothetical protein [Actinomycetota bacterium]
MRNGIDQPVGRLAGDIGAALTGIGILLMVLFPFAIPALLLAAVLAAPLVLPVAALAIAAALAAVSFRAIRWLARRPRQLANPSVTFTRRSGSMRVRPAKAGDLIERST